MNAFWPDYLQVSQAALGAGQPVKVRQLGDTPEVARDMAAAMLETIQRCIAAQGRAVLIVPVGPVDQYPLLAEAINSQQFSLRDVTFITMDEYLTDDDHWIDEDHPLSFRGYLNRLFYDLLEPSLAPPLENRLVPDPQDPQKLTKWIDTHGGVDACFGGIGINGHMAFNEPPEPGEVCTVEEFAARPTRVLSLSRETRTINSVTVGGEISIVPRRAVTVGMKEILAARTLRFYCNRPWQSCVVRRLLHGPITSACPASLLRTHPDAVLTVAGFVAEEPEIGLR